jgi:hypothetical protein
VLARIKTDSIIRDQKLSAPYDTTEEVLISQKNETSGIGY